jgi:hypothetical protein
VSRVRPTYYTTESTDWKGVSEQEYPESVADPLDRPASAARRCGVSEGMHLLGIGKNNVLRILRVMLHKERR